MKIFQLRCFFGLLFLIYIPTSAVVAQQFTTYTVSSVNHTRHTNTGNVLIGSTSQTTAPLDKLEVVGNIRASGNLLFGATAGTGLFHVNSSSLQLNKLLLRKL